jgi:hypothetical protein
MNRERPLVSALRPRGGRSRFIVEDSGSRRPHLVTSAPSTGDLTTVLGGVKGALAPLGSFAALDPACAPRATASTDGAGPIACFSGAVGLVVRCPRLWPVASSRSR